jgi:hypothetical protein
MYFIIILIIITVVIIELDVVSIFFRESVENKADNKQKLNIEDINKKYSEYILSGDKKIKHLPGNIYIKDDYNIFITINNSQFLMLKDVIYKLVTDFTLETIDVNGDSFVYYYIKS